MPTVGVNNGEIVRLGFDETWVTAVPKITNEPKRMEGCSVKEPVPPVLGVT